MSFIDAHVHVWTDDLAAYPLAAGYTRAEMSPATFPPEVLLGHARPCGVERIVLIQMSYYGCDNSYLLDTIAAQPGVFGGVAVIDHTAADVEGEMDRLLARGVRGFRLQPAGRPAGEWLCAPGYDRMFAHAATTGQAMCCLLNPDGLPDLARMCEAFPETTVVIDHLARIGIDGEIRDEEAQALCALARYPRVHVKISAFYALGAKQPPYTDLLPLVGQVLAAYGAERLMWATDCPFQVQSVPYEASLALVRDHLQCSPAERDWLLRGTAERLFF